MLNLVVRKENARL